MSQMPRQDPLIENHTVEYVPLAERRGKARDLFTLWFSTNIAPLPGVSNLPAPFPESDGKAPPSKSKKRPLQPDVAATRG